MLRRLVKQQCGESRRGSPGTWVRVTASCLRRPCAWAAGRLVRSGFSSWSVQAWPRRVPDQTLRRLNLGGTRLPALHLCVSDRPCWCCRAVGCDLSLSVRLETARATLSACFANCCTIATPCFNAVSQIRKNWSFLRIFRYCTCTRTFLKVPCSFSFFHISGETDLPRV
jgi:hypothetical protein